MSVVLIIVLIIKFAMSNGQLALFYMTVFLEEFYIFIKRNHILFTTCHVGRP